MMASPQHILAHSPEARDHAAPLFGASTLMYANGEWPFALDDPQDVIAVGPDAEWCNALCRIAARLNCAKIRFAVADLTQIEGNPLKWLRERLQPYVPSSAPQVDEGASLVVGAEGNPHPPITPTLLPAAAEPTSSPDEPPLELARSAQDEAILDLHASIPLEGAESSQRAVRNASALKRAVFEDVGSVRAGEWPEPADFWGATALPEFLPQYLPPAIEPYVTDQASRSGIDPAQIALNCYVICAALIRGGIELQMQDDSGDGRVWKERPILWGAVVGEPSSGKGPGLDIAVHKFFKIASALRLKDEEAWERYDEDLKIHEKKMQQYIAEAAKPGANPGRPVPPEKPPRERLWTDDTTKEVVARLITENPRGKIAILKDELAGWFGGFDAYGNGKSDKDRPDWLTFYESKERYIDRQTEGRSYHVPSWGGVILGGIQPERLAAVQNKLGADGMLQRFQIIVSKAKRQVPKRPADAEAVKDWNRILENLAAMQPGAHPITLSEEAAPYMDAQAQWIAETMQAGFTPSIVAALGKWEGLFGRLMITSHCIECAAHGLIHPTPLVSLRTAEQAWGWMRWILWPHAVHFYTGSMLEEFSLGKGFADYMLARNLREIKPHVLNSGWSRYRTNLTTIQMRREFWVRLEQFGWVRPLTPMDRNTLIAHEYAINPRVFDGRFSEQAKTAEISVIRYRQAMHPAMLAKQGREPGED